MDKLRWFICCFHGYNADNMLKIALDLSNDFGAANVFCPTHLEKKFNRKTQTYSYDEVPRFGGYVFVHVPTVSDASAVISKKYARYYFVTSGSNTIFAEVDQSEIDSMKANSCAVQHSLFRQNDMVVINAGPFKNFTGVISAVDEEKKTAQISVDVFDKPVIITLSYDQIDIA